jgi:hypothetical protein
VWQDKDQNRLADVMGRYGAVEHARGAGSTGVEERTGANS